MKTKPNIVEIDEPSENLEELIQSVIEEAHLVITDSLSQMEDAHHELSAYELFDITQQYKRYLKRLHSETADLNLASNLAKALNQLQNEELSQSVVDSTLKEFTKGKEPSVPPLYDYGKRLRILGQLMAVCCASATYFDEYQRHTLAIELALKAGTALGKIHGIKEEIQRNQFERDLLDTAEYVKIHLEVEKSGREARSKGGIAKRDNDPKSLFKQIAKGHWKQWQKQPNAFKSVADFVRALNKQFPETTFNYQVMHRWIKEWSSLKNLSNTS